MQAAEAVGLKQVVQAAELAVLVAAVLVVIL
jgi:hypothetical protein